MHLGGRSSAFRSWATSGSRSTRLCLAVSGVVVTYHVGQIASQSLPFSVVPDRRVRGALFASISPVRTFSSSFQQQQQQIRQSADQWQLYRVGGDGNCMFRAAVQGAHWALTGRLLSVREEGEAAMKLRLDVVRELQKRRSDIEPFLPGITSDFEAYLQHMSRPSTWGGEPEVLMASHVLRCPIRVYSAAQGLERPVVTYGEEYFSSRDEGGDGGSATCINASPVAESDAALLRKQGRDVDNGVVKNKPPMDLLWSGNHYDLLIPPSHVSSQGSD